MLSRESHTERGDKLEQHYWSPDVSGRSRDTNHEYAEHRDIGRNCLYSATATSPISVAVVALVSVLEMNLFDRHHSRSSLDQASIDPIFFFENSNSVFAHFANPSITTFIASIVVYCVAIGLYYYRGAGSRHRDTFLVGGASIGTLIGAISGLDMQGIIFRVLPGFILATTLIHSVITTSGFLN
ncbi:uncharacterized protein F4822DRAFT_51571 [Hypoxylon trugodes]|uniref:uncharacterized protein n=1 Tax=Hypoxylon trugodes TaxID=326681 RepID=UPI00218EEB89|nr:uncharacterized protein F4822DRAFT_51571 [Hypoxylon trugodes]KAI1383791.1 hypothetical protein F4822DRAFT_51571 [Hypoxylon trugodes]